jgi:hypothetical protein
MSGQFATCLRGYRGLLREPERQCSAVSSGTSIACMSERPGATAPRSLPELRRESDPRIYRLIG